MITLIKYSLENFEDGSNFADFFKKLLCSSYVRKEKILRNIFKPLILSITVIVIVSMFTNCSMEQSIPDQYGQSEETGSLLLKITTDSTSVYSYIITLEGPENQVVNTNAGEDGNVTIDNLSVGYWSINVDAIDNSDESIGLKNDAVNIVANKRTTCEIAIILAQSESSEIFRDDFDGTAVNETVWQIATWQEESITGRERCYVKDGYLNLVFKNDNGTFLGAAIQTRKEFLYGRWEARLKPTKERGVLNSFFTIDWEDTTTVQLDDGTKQEIDIEFLTNSFGQDSGQVHYAVHAIGKTSFNTNPDVSLGFNPSDDFHIYAIDITPGYVQWLVDGQVLKTYTYAGNDISIDAPYMLKLNVYTQNGSWVGGPPTPGVECVYQIDWIRFIQYTEE